jgi:hypothetical protein
MEYCFFICRRFNVHSVTFFSFLFQKILLQHLLQTVKDIGMWFMKLTVVFTLYQVYHKQKTNF